MLFRDVSVLPVLSDWKRGLKQRSDKIRAYLDLPDVRETLGVEHISGNWSSCAPSVGRAFGASLDASAQTWIYVANLLERGIRVLNVYIYSRRGKML